MSNNFSHTPKVNPIIVMSTEESKTLIEVLVTKGYKLFSINCSGLKSKDELLTLIARSIHFPTYFGKNWDALEECLNDMEWMPANGYIMLLLNVEDLIHCCRSDLKIFIQILQSVSKSWDRNNIVFTSIIETNSKAEVLGLLA